MRVGFRDTVFRLARLLSAPGGLMDFIVYGGAVACKKGSEVQAGHLFDLLTFRSSANSSPSGTRYCK